jgi:hypothetical protein
MPGWYSWVAVVLLTMTTAFGSVLICLRIAERAVEAERTARIAAAEEGRRQICQLAIAQDEAYSEPPGPSTETGKNASRAWKETRAFYRCDQK